jgi:allantoinase
VLVVRGRRLITGGEERPATIHIEDGRIVRIGSYDDWPAGGDDIDAGRLVVSPGIIDTHVHVNEPGRTEWEGFDTATRAAAAGGVTAVVDMPLNSVPATTTVQALEEKRRAAAGNCHVDVAFWGGVVPGNDDELEALVEAGVRGFKCFLVPSGVDEFPHVTEADLRRAMPILAGQNVPLLVHAESPDRLVGADLRVGRLGGHTGPPLQAYSTYLATRPPEAEVEAVQLMIGLAAEFGARVHIVHVAAARAVDEIARARARGVSVTAETCPHYLTFTAEEIPDGATAFKCAPPIRGRSHRDALWSGLAAGTLDLVATDHSPSPPALKCGSDFLRAWGGIASLELSLAATWTAASARGFTPIDLARWLSERPAVLAGLGERKGAIAEGKDADLVLWDPDGEVTVEASRLQQRHKLTPYAGRRLRGRVQTTIVRGQRVWDDGRLERPRSGQLL